VMVAAGNVHSLALKADGTVRAWGNNNYSQTTVPVGLNGVAGMLQAVGTVLRSRATAP
jgi:alpha-tubulin suppressor-like RCC1 family protein